MPSDDFERDHNCKRFNDLALNIAQIIWVWPKDIESAKVAALILVAARQKSDLDRLSQRF